MFPQVGEEAVRLFTNDKLRIKLPVNVVADRVLNVSALVGALSLSDVTLGSGAPLEIALALESSDVSGDYAFSSLEEVAPMLVLSVVAAPPPTSVPSRTNAASRRL